MRRNACVLAVAFASLAAAGVAMSGNYGGVSASYAAKMQRYIHAWFDPSGVGSVMVCIAERESGLNPRAYNTNDAWRGESVAGLFQIKWPLWAANNPRIPESMKRFWHYRSVTWPQFQARLADPVQSIRLAFLLYKHGGLGPWGGGC